MLWVPDPELWSRTIVCVRSQRKGAILLSMGETLGWENEGASVRRTYKNKVPGEQRRTVLPTNLPDISAGHLPPIRARF